VVLRHIASVLRRPKVRAVDFRRPPHQPLRSTLQDASVVVRLFESRLRGCRCAPRHAEDARQKLRGAAHDAGRPARGTGVERRGRRGHSHRDRTTRDGTPRVRGDVHRLLNS
jgi:hypothetical protein